MDNVEKHNKNQNSIVRDKIEETKHQNLMNNIIDIFNNKICVPVTPNDINQCYKMGKKDDNN